MLMMIVKIVKPHVEIYGHAHDALTFYAMPLTDTYRPKTENTRLGSVSVEGGVMTIPQIVKQLQRLVPVDQFQWELMQVGQNIYKVQFPSKAELDRLKTFGTFKVPQTTNLS